MAPTPAAERGERVRRLLSPAVALVSAGLALCCLVTVPDIVAGHRALAVLDGRLPGWAGLSVVVAVAVAALSLLCCGRLGSSAPLALGAAAALLGSALSADISSSPQLVLAMLTLAVAIGALVAAVLCMLEELPPVWARASLVGWLVPMAGGWALLGWSGVQGRGAATRFGVHPPGWALALAVLLLLLWAIMTLLLEPVRPPSPSGVGWENAWAALGTLVVGVGSIAMLVGFQRDVSASWVRPVVVLASAVTFGALVVCGRLVPLPRARPALIAVVAALLAGPSCLHLLILVSWQATGPLSPWLGVVFALAGLVGCWFGWRHAELAVSAGLVVMALAAAAGWLMPANPWLMCLAATPFAAGIAAACGGGVRLAAASRMALRYVGTAGLAALLLGLLSAAPLAWALGAPLLGRPTAVRDGGRVLLGLTFALTVLAAAAAWVLVRRAAEVAVPEGSRTDRAEESRTDGAEAIDETDGGRGRAAPLTADLPHRVPNPTNHQP